jgi:hypothetical protein
LIARRLCLLVQPVVPRPSLRTAAGTPRSFPDTCALPAGAASALVAFVAVEVGSEVVAWVVAGPEGSSPWAAGVLVVDAVSSMGAGRPTDCASFTTSLVTCSAITVSGTVVAEDSLSDSCSVDTKETGVAGADSCVSCPVACPSTMRAMRRRKAEGYSPNVRRYKSPRGYSGRFRRTWSASVVG